VGADHETVGRRRGGREPGQGPLGIFGDQDAVAELEEELPQRLLGFLSCLNEHHATPLSGGGCGTGRRGGLGSCHPSQHPLRPAPHVAGRLPPLEGIERHHPAHEVDDLFRQPRASLAERQNLGIPPRVGPLGAVAGILEGRDARDRHVGDRAEEIDIAADRVVFHPGQLLERRVVDRAGLVDSSEGAVTRLVYPGETEVDEFRLAG
jgi:hypothetical protein